jgi:tRNA pseudouridine55 synthase
MKKDQVLKLYKKVGETPLECLERFRKNHPKFKNQKMTYAGRLDPLAEGELLVLVGESCKNKEKYLKLDKEYLVDILFGFETDSYDLLGLPVSPGKRNQIIRASPIFSEEKGLPALHNFNISFLLL